MKALSKKQSQIQTENLPDYTEIDGCGNESIEEVIYGDRNFVGSGTLEPSEYEELNLPQTNQQKLSDIPDEDFPSYNTTFQKNPLHPQVDTSAFDYSHIVFPKNVITPHVQVSKLNNPTL